MYEIYISYFSTNTPWEWSVSKMVAVTEGEKEKKKGLSPNLISK